MRATCGHSGAAEATGPLHAILPRWAPVRAAIVPGRVAHAERPVVTRLPVPPPGEPPETASV